MKSQFCIYEVLVHTNSKLNLVDDPLYENIGDSSIININPYKPMHTIMKYILLLSLLIITGCASYTVSKESLVEQLKENEGINKTRNVASVGTAYSSNNLAKIKCFDKDGKEVLINADKNTTFVLTNATTGKTVTLYFDTVYLSNDSIIGLKSRIVGGKSRTALNDISSIQVKTEN